MAHYLEDCLDRLPPVRLDELDKVAALLTRRDRKYILPIPAAERLVDALEGRCRVLEIDGRRHFRYESVYFDTADHISYLGAARRRTRRFKVRTRSYLDTGRCSWRSRPATLAAAPSRSATSTRSRRAIASARRTSAFSARAPSSGSRLAPWGQS